MKTKCFSFEATGHKFRPLDGIAGVCLRLFCQRCGRIQLADLLNNTGMWSEVDLPRELALEATPGDRNALN